MFRIRSNARHAAPTTVARAMGYLRAAFRRPSTYFGLVTAAALAVCVFCYNKFQSTPISRFSDSPLYLALQGGSYSRLHAADGITWSNAMLTSLAVAAFGFAFSLVAYGFEKARAVTS